MALSGTDQAYLYARSGIARSGATRSNYVAVRTSIDWIVRDGAGNVISTTDLSDRILHGSLHVTQALNDEPDTCSFELGPQASVSSSTIGYRERVIADGASHYWRLDEASGTTASDAIGGAHGTISGGVTLGAAGALADGTTAMTFNGTTGKIQIASVTIPVIATVEVWVKTTGTGYQSLLSSRLVSTGSALTLFLHDGLEAYGVNPSASAYFLAANVANGAWHHLAVVMDGVVQTLYVDGLVSPTGSLPFARLTPSVGACVLGQDTESSSLYFPGALDEVAIYPRALTAPEIAAHYALRTAPAGVTVVPTVPKVGEEIRVTWAPGGTPLFHGYVLTTQQDWRLRNLQPPWVAVQCQDPMWRFDARIVTYRFPAQSVTASIQFLVQWFCNLQPFTPGPLDFSTAFVQPGMPAIPALDVVNQRPSTVMRTLTASVGGGFYLEGLTLHAWASSLSEPNQPNPQPLTVGLKTLHAFRRTEDATQVRRSVLVEGRRTTTLIALPTIDSVAAFPIGVPLADATFFDPALGIDYNHLVRMGTQWVRFQNPISVTGEGRNPPQAKLTVAFVPGDGVLQCDALAPPPPFQGWIRIGNQYAAYQSSATAAGTLTLTLASAIHPYGQLTAPMPIDTIVEWVDCVMEDYARPLQWLDPTIHDPLVYHQLTETPVVILAVAQAPLDGWPPLEGFVQDGRYSYAGAQARADDDLATFQDPLVSVEWETDDLNALPGRTQAIALSSDVVIPPINTTVTITRVEIMFSQRTRPPRRRCAGATVKPSTFLDLVLTSTN